LQFDYTIGGHTSAVSSLWVQFLISNLVTVTIISLVP
jgi:hypothetical protein